MNVLGISGSRADASAALAVDGEVIAAASEESFIRVPHIGYRRTGGFPDHAARACLARAGLSLEEISKIAVVTDGHCGPAVFQVEVQQGVSAAGFPSSDIAMVDSLRAHAAQVAGATEVDDALVIVMAPRSSGEGKTYAKRGGSLTERGSIRGVGALADAASLVARELGCGGADPFGALEQLATLGEPDLAEKFRAAMFQSDDTGLTVIEEAVSQILQDAAGTCPSPLSDAASLNIRVQAQRRSIAASFWGRVTEMACETVEGLRASGGEQVAGVGGDLFASSGVRTRLRTAHGPHVFVAPVPESRGLAIGAALAVDAWQSRRRFSTLVLGPEFSEIDIKETLDNCRLDYVYEPDWGRLLARVSAMLSRGKTVAWFQGPMGFGPASIGGRAVLANPSNRYARENINGFLKRRALDHPLTLSMTEDCARECLGLSLGSPFGPCSVRVNESWKDRLRSALDVRNHAEVRTVGPETSLELWRLLETHHRTSGVPGLITTSLRAPGESTACTPRDAIRTTYSSAIDALVMGRFLLMKDYWLLRSPSES